MDDQFLKNLKWPNCIIDSSDFGSKPNFERMHQLSLAYLKAAQRLCVAIGEETLLQEWPNASVVYFLIYHSTELFLKASILKQNPKCKELHHDIGKLKEFYRELFPEEENNFHSPWGFSAKKIDELFGEPVFSGIDRNPDQKYRYFSDKSGGSPKSINSFSPGYILNYINYLSIQWNKLWMKQSEKG